MSSNPNDHLLKQLQKQLDEMKAMTPLPLPATKEALQMEHKAWMGKHQEIMDQGRRAETIALWAVPDDVWQLLQGIKKQQQILLGYLEPKDDKK